MTENHPDPSDSKVQRDLEHTLLSRLEKGHSDWIRSTWKSVAGELHLPEVWKKAQPDAVWKTLGGGIIVAECFAHLGNLKAGQRRKLAWDVLKLQGIRSVVSPSVPITCLIVVPQGIDSTLKGNSWLSEAIRTVAELHEVELTPEERSRLKEGIERQASGQARLRKGQEEAE